MTLLTFVLGMVALDGAFAWLVDRYSSSDYRQTVASKADFDAKHRYDVWILGDSLAVDGVSPSTITSKTGLSAYDWGLYASSPFEWNILERDLEHRATLPKTIVVVCHPEMFIKKPNDGPFARAAVKTPALQLALMSGSVERADLSAILASGRRRLMLKGVIAGILHRNRVDADAVVSDNGHLVHRKGLTEIPHLMFDALKFDEKNASFQADAFEQLVGRCVQGGAKVALAKIPVSEWQLQEYMRDAKTFHHYNETLRRIVDKFGLRTYDVQTAEDCSAYTAPDFTDAIHLSERGAVKFTAGLAAWLRVQSP